MLKRFGYDRDLEVSSVPIIFKMLDTMKVPEVKIDPATAKVGEGFVPIGQRENFLTRFWGTLGMKIREEVYDWFCERSFSFSYFIWNKKP